VFCSHCGAAIGSASPKYCIVCGALLAEPRIPTVQPPKIQGRRQIYPAAGIAALLLFLAGAAMNLDWLVLIAGSVLIFGTVALVVRAVVRYARRHGGKRTIIMGSVCLALSALVALSVKYGSGLQGHSEDDRLVVRRTAATVGLARTGAFSPDGRILATGDERGVHSWDTATWRELSFVSTPFAVDGLVYSADSSRLAILSNAQTYVLDMRSGQISSQFPERAEAAAFSADGTRLRVYIQENGKAALATWDLASGRRVATFAGLSAPASRSMAAFSPDGVKLAVAGEGGLIRIRDARNGTDIISLSAPTDTSLDKARLEVSPDGRKVAVIGPDMNASVLDATASGRVLQTVSCNGADALAAAFSPDGARIAVACEMGTDRGTVRVFEIASGKLIFDFQDHFSDSRPVWVGFSPDGSRLATPDNVWDTRRAAGMQRGDPPEAMKLDFSADSAKVFGAGFGAGTEFTMTAATVRTWNTSDGREIGRFTIPTNYPGIEVAAFSPDHSKVLVASRGNQSGAQVFSMENGALLYELPDNGWPFHDAGPFRDSVGAASFSPDGSRIVTGESGGGNHSHRGYIWDAQTGRRLHDLRSGGHYGFGGMFSPDGRKLIAEIDSNIIAAWEVSTAKLLYRLGDMTGAAGLKLSADGTRLLFLSRKDVPPDLAQCSVQVRDAATGLLLHAIQFGLHGVSDHTSAGDIRYLAYAFSPDGSEVMIGGEENGSTHVLSTVSGGLVRSFVGHVGPVDSVAFSPDGSMVLTAGDDHTVRLWNHEDGRLLHILEGHQGSVQHAFFSPDGSRVVAYTDNDRIWLWDVKTGRGIELQ
jgi:WD40 repeat protein